MKKKNLINLIRYHVEKNESAFRAEALAVAKYFYNNGDNQVADYIMGLLSDANVFMPQGEKCNLNFFEKIDIGNTTLPLPNTIANDIYGIINAVKHHNGINKFLFEGPPGTGKTESVKQIARILSREIFSVDFNSVIDSKMGQTQKNISEVFSEIKMLPNPEKTIILFDEIDAIAMDRINSRDVREMGRATSSVLKELDNLDIRVIFIATTNLYKNLDKALTRRFDAIVNFDRYLREDLLDIAEIILNEQLPRFETLGRDIKLFRKIINLLTNIPYPGELKNIIRTSLAFSDPNSEFDYLRRLYIAVLLQEKIKELSLKELKDKKFTVRDIEKLTGTPKSNVSRKLKENRYE
jgi:SpoVK/Ycf46/Vps4 family AAA+-type ATPase